MVEPIEQVEEIIISEEDRLFETEDYCVVITKVPDPQFINGNIERWVYAVVNKLTGIQEQFVNSMPAAFNWCNGLQEALEAFEEAHPGEPEPDADPDQQELLH